MKTESVKQALTESELKVDEVLAAVEEYLESEIERGVDEQLLSDYVVSVVRAYDGIQSARKLAAHL